MKKREYIIEFIKRQKTVFVGSVDEDGFPNIKAMFTPRKIAGNCFYFSTNTSSMRSRHFMKNPKASIYFYKRGRFKYEGIMLIGEFSLAREVTVSSSSSVISFIITSAIGQTWQEVLLCPPQ